MKIGIMQPYFFPYFGYFQLVEAVDTFCLYEHVSFRKKSWITRNRILNKGTLDPTYFNLPVKGKSSYKSIGEIKIDNSIDWRKSILDALYFNYKKAPLFDATYSQIEKLIQLKIDSLHAYNAEIIKSLSAWLGCETKIISKSTKEVENELADGVIDPSLDIKTNRVIKLCQLHEASHYINPAGGVELYNKEQFAINKLKLSFLNSNPSKYTQWGQEFIPYLSIIDMMMHLPKSDMQHLLKSYSLS